MKTTHQETLTRQEHIVQDEGKAYLIEHAALIQQTLDKYETQSKALTEEITKLKSIVEQIKNLTGII